MWPKILEVYLQLCLLVSPVCVCKEIIASCFCYFSFPFTLTHPVLNIARFLLHFISKEFLGEGGGLLPHNVKFPPISPQVAVEGKKVFQVKELLSQLSPSWPPHLL